MLREQTMAAPRLIQWLLVRLSLADFVLTERASPSAGESGGSGVLTIMMKFVEWPVVSRVP